MGKTILSTQHLCKYYPGVKANDDISIEIYEGEVHAFVGENGAGKSTLVKMIAGAHAPDSGTITIDGKKYESLKPEQARELGIEVIYQEFNLIPGMTCAENIYLNKKTNKGFVVNAKERSRMAKALFDSMGVDVDPDRPVGSYTPGYMQIVEISKAIGQNVRILIMDEPTAPLTVAEVEIFFRIIRQLKEKGVTIIYISHRLEEIFEIADRVSVFRDGRYIDTKDIKDTDRQELINKMVGRELKETYPKRKVEIGEETLRAENLCGNGVKNINFTAHKGEILGFAGLVGAGRTELMNVIYGAAKQDSGTLYLHGKPVKFKTPTDAIARGIGLIPEDRKTLGVFQNWSISWNMVIMCLKKVSKNLMINVKKEKELADKYIKELGVKTPSSDQLVRNLSGGNQQKVVLAKTMAAETEILIFDEPTRGIDVGAKQEIYALMNRLAEEGHTILMVSSDLPELIGMSDRIVVLSEKEQAGIVDMEGCSQELILDLASGNK